MEPLSRDYSPVFIGMKVNPRYLNTECCTYFTTFMNNLYVIRLLGIVGISLKISR